MSLGRLLALLIATSACSLVNDLDVCTSAPAPSDVNQHVDGQQTLESSRAMTVMPSGEALVLFSSTVGGRAADQALEVRSVRLTSAGAPLDGCTKRDVREQVLYPVDLAEEGPQLARALQVVPAPGAMGITSTGLTLLTHRVGSAAPVQLIAMSMYSQGCFGAASEPSVLNVAEPDRSLAPDVLPQAVALPVKGGTEPYATFWVENSVMLRRAVMARMIRTKGGLVLPEVTDAAPDGEPIDLELPGGPIVLALAALTTVPGELMLIWVAADLQGSYSILMARYDFELQLIAPHVVLAANVSAGASLPGSRVLAAFDGEHVLVVSAQGRAEDTTRIVAQSFLPDGRAAGSAEVVGGAAAANDSVASLTAFPGGGFVVAWRQQLSSPGAGASAVGLRMVALDTFGRKAFSNMACRDVDFEVAAAGSGDIQQSSLAVAPDGRVLLAFQQTASSESLSQSDLSMISLEPKQLFPSGKLRPTSDRAPAVGSPPQTIGGVHPSCTGPLAGQAGHACTCTDKCDDPAAICRTEDLSGRAGGFCHLECDPAANGGCPAGTVCEPNTQLDGGLCLVECHSDGDCDFGQVCSAVGNRCWSICSSASDCRSGTCDSYSGSCGNIQSNPDGAGLVEPCVNDVDCRSLYCGRANDRSFPGRCESFCRADQPTCPEGGVCIPLSGNLGVCAPPCAEGNVCPAGLDCYELLDLDVVPVCLVH